MLYRSFNSTNKYLQQTCRKISISSRIFTVTSKYTQGSEDENANEHREARAWLATFNVKDLPKQVCEVHFSRASGPGGQNVNKVHTKANLRIKTSELLPLVPKLLRPAILASRYHAENSNSLVISGDGSRSQTENLNECYKKLHAAVIAAGKTVVRGETSQGTVEKVKALHKRANENRLLGKKAHGKKKAARSSFRNQS